MQTLSERKIGGKTSDFRKITRIALLPLPLNIVWCKMVPLGCGLSSGLTATMWLELAAAAVGEWEAALGIKSFLTAIGTEGAEETGALAEAGAWWLN